MKSKKTICLAAILISIGLAQFLAAEDYLRFLTPRSGWSTNRIIYISGETNLKLKWINVLYNGVPLPLPVVNGKFERRFVASPGVNYLYVEGLSNGKVLQDRVFFYSSAMSKPIKMVLVWDTDGTHVDLWVTEPSGEICKWNYKQTKHGGNMDIGTDYPGYGPQIYTYAAVPKGNFKVDVHYFSSANHPQTTAKIYVILNEGKPNEEIKEYEVMLTVAGQMFAVASLEF